MFLGLAVYLVQTSPKLVWAKSISGYRVEKWKLPEPQDANGSDYEAIRLVDRKGKLVTEVHDYRVGVNNLDRNSPPHKLEDIDKDGNLDIVVETWTGGAHGSNRYFVWSLGKQPRCVLGYDKNNVSDEHDFEFVDLDRDGKPEIRTWYDGYYYRDHGPEGYSLRSGQLPVVLKYQRGRYVDCTKRFPLLFREFEKEIWVNFTSQITTRGFGPKEPGQHSEAISLIGLGYEFGRTSYVWRKLKARVGKKEYAWCWRNRWVIRKVVADRLDRYSYPAVGAKIATYGESKCKTLPPIRVPSS